MRFNYLDFILFHIFFLATLSVQAKYFNDSTLSKDAVELDMHTKEINGLKLLHLWQSLDQDSLAINPDVVFIMAGKMIFTNYIIHKLSTHFHLTIRK